MSDLTADEVEIIQRRRKEQQKKCNAIEFQHEAISTAMRFSDWSERTGYGLTFSTFVNQFEYQHPDASDMYRAVERIMHAALPE